MDFKKQNCLLKRLGFILAVFVLLFSVPAYADIIYEPNDDGSVVKSPEDNTVLREYQPEEFFSTNTSYQSGDTIWYYIPDFDHSDKAGWISNNGKPLIDIARETQWKE